MAILKFCEDAILSKKDSADLHAYMRSLGDVLTDVNRISQVLACFSHFLLTVEIRLYYVSFISLCSAYVREHSDIQKQNIPRIFRKYIYMLCRVCTTVFSL